MMYQQLIQKLFSKRERTSSKDHQQLILDVQSLGNPQLSYPTVHVAGTNGKGSVTTKIAKTLEYSGYKVGLFISPHIHRFGERIQINGFEIAEEDVVRLLPPLMEEFPDYCFFDYCSFLAFQYFKENKIDVGIFEAGIGGLHDTTNVVMPVMSVITSVGLDHLEMLGNTLDAIAFQKAGIIKPGVPVVVGPKARLKPVLDQAEASNSLLMQVPPTGSDYEIENQAIAQVALQTLSPIFPLSEAALQKGLLARPSCRFERCGRFVMDVAHNVEGFESLLKTWECRYPGKRFVAVVGFSSDKDIEACLRLIAQRADHLFLVSADSARAASLLKLEEILKEAKISHFTSCPTIERAITSALASDHDILICGSFYIMKQAREQVLGLQVG